MVAEVDTDKDNLLIEVAQLRTELEGSVSSLNDALAAETSERTTAIESLHTSLLGALDELQAALAAESEARNSADVNLSQAITTAADQVEQTIRPQVDALVDTVAALVATVNEQAVNPVDPERVVISSPDGRKWTLSVGNDAAVVSKQAPAVPIAPSSLTATVNADRSVTVMFVPDLGGYDAATATLHVDLLDSVGAVLSTTDSHATPVILGPLAPGSYSVRARVTNPKGTGPYSSTVSFTIVGEAPWTFDYDFTDSTAYPDGDQPLSRLGWNETGTKSSISGARHSLNLFGANFATKVLPPNAAEVEFHTDALTVNNGNQSMESLFLAFRDADNAGARVRMTSTDSTTTALLTDNNGNDASLGTFPTQPIKVYLQMTSATTVHARVTSLTSGNVLSEADLTTPRMVSNGSLGMYLYSNPGYVGIRRVRAR